LRFLSYPNFEVVVVAGPCTDDTADLLRSYEGSIKWLSTENRNLSSSRNLGVQAAAGEIVAFIDDDSIPDGLWLTNLVDAFADQEVAATGGPVFDHTGHELQSRYSLADRWGESHIEFEPRRLDHLQRPGTWHFPYAIGTNSLYRRDTLISIGGFDENYAFYLDDTDVSLRLIDHGYRVVAQDRGAVHHKFLPSRIRNDQRITVDRFHVLASRLYFGIRHGLPRSNDMDLWFSFADFVHRHRADLVGHIAARRIPSGALQQFDLDVKRVYALVQDRVSQPPQTRPAAWFHSGCTPFLAQSAGPSLGRRFRMCLVPGGARHVEALAAGLAAFGHLVHLIAGGSGHGTVDFEDGVWVHRVVSSPHESTALAEGPAGARADSVSVLEEIRRIDQFTPVDAVVVAKGEDEGVAVVADAAYPVVEVLEDFSVDQTVTAVEASVDARRE
jgi:GT2 family glycosyltransferase